MCDNQLLHEHGLQLDREHMDVHIPTLQQLDKQRLDSLKDVTLNNYCRLIYYTDMPVRCQRRITDTAASPSTKTIRATFSKVDAAAF